MLDSVAMLTLLSCLSERPVLPTRVMVTFVCVLLNHVQVHGPTTTGDSIDVRGL